MKRVFGIGGMSLIVLLFGLSGSPAAAHPLGNFTINHFSGLEIGPHAVDVHYVVDMAEIPTFQELSRLTSSSDEIVSTARLQTFASGLAPVLLKRVALSAEDTAVDLTLAGVSARLRPGQGGLRTLRIEATFHGELPDAAETLHYTDDNYRDRIGWSEVIAYPRKGQGIRSSSVPARSISDALLSYPNDMLSSPLDVRSAVVTTEPGAGSAGAAGAPTVGGSSNGALASNFVALIQHKLSVWFLLAALALAMVAGGLHALGPGHGKSIMAAYLVGADGKLRHAIAIGIAVSLMHTLSVIALGLLTLSAETLFPPETVFPWLSLLSGVVVLGLGLWLFRNRLTSWRRFVARTRGATGDTHDEGHHGHEHSHTHNHPHDHGHSHAEPDLRRSSSPTSWKSLGILAVSGGLLPSPAALIVLLAAVALHRVAFGLVLVGAFSVGLAGALTVVGMVVLKARTFATRRFGERIGTALPLLSSAAVLLLGIFLTARGAINL